MSEARESIRPILQNTGSTEHKNAEEKFQNTTLRPIIKLQHDLLVAFFANYVNSKKIDLSALNAARKNEIVSGIFKTDNSLKTEIRGLIIGHFTVEEYKTYVRMAADANKRMLAMIKERLLSVLLS